MLGEMLQLEDTHADVYQSFMDKTFSVQLSYRNTLGRIEPENVLRWRSTRIQKRQMKRLDFAQIQIQSLGGIPMQHIERNFAKRCMNLQAIRSKGFYINISTKAEYQIKKMSMQFSKFYQIFSCHVFQTTPF